MPKFVKNSTYEKLLDDVNKESYELVNLRLKLDESNRKLEALEKEVEDLKVLLEEEKEKYQKYAKNLRAKKNEAARKWLNGYPDE
jgi:predicted  nucleic acid-binding Zn-ribbon protein